MCHNLEQSSLMFSSCSFSLWYSSVSRLLLLWAGLSRCHLWPTCNMASDGCDSFLPWCLLVVLATMIRALMLSPRILYLDCISHEWLTHIFNISFLFLSMLFIVCFSQFISGCHPPDLFIIALTTGNPLFAAFMKCDEFLSPALASLLFILGF